MDFERIRDFIILHYHANQRDEPLWRARREMELPESLAERLALFRACGRLFQHPEEMFTATSWQAVLNGQRIRPRSYDSLVDPHDTDRIAAEFEQIRREIRQTTDAMPTSFPRWRAPGKAITLRFEDLWLYHRAQS